VDSEREIVEDGCGTAESDEVADEDGIEVASDGDAGICDVGRFVLASATLFISTFDRASSFDAEFPPAEHLCDVIAVDEEADSCGIVTKLSTVDDVGAVLGCPSFPGLEEIPVFGMDTCGVGNVVDEPPTD
jgi:hypothetical protein